MIKAGIIDFEVKAFVIVTRAIEVMMNIFEVIPRPFIVLYL